MTVQYPAPLTTQTRELEGRKSQPPQGARFTVRPPGSADADEHANLYRPSPFSVFPCVKVNLFSLAECTHGHITLHTSTHLCWARIPGCTRGLADSSCPMIIREGHLLIRGIQGGVRREAEGMWCMERESQSVSVWKKTWSLWMTMLSPALGK